MNPYEAPQTFDEPEPTLFWLHLCAFVGIVGGAIVCVACVLSNWWWWGGVVLFGIVFVTAGMCSELDMRYDYLHAKWVNERTWGTES